MCVQCTYVYNMYIIMCFTTGEPTLNSKVNKLSEVLFLGRAEEPATATSYSGPHTSSNTKPTKPHTTNPSRPRPTSVMSVLNLYQSRGRHRNKRCAMHTCPASVEQMDICRSITGDNHCFYILSLNDDSRFIL